LTATERLSIGGLPYFVGLGNESGQEAEFLHTKFCENFEAFIFVTSEVINLASSTMNAQYHGNGFIIFLYLLGSLYT
jgi:hypothetical protein